MAEVSINKLALSFHALIIVFVEFIIVPAGVSIFIKIDSLCEGVTNLFNVWIIFSKDLFHFIEIPFITLWSSV
jgi:hypothetical protein